MAKVIGAASVYSDDGDARPLCVRKGIDRQDVWDLPARPVEPQHKLDL